ncbi:glycosyltransferase family 4 protein, partial [bacterium]|nr:glycosyltransferase family 4 protein [bacterium]
SGRFVPEKGVNLYVNAITKVAKKFPDWKFRLIGSAYLGSSNKQTDFALKTIENFQKIGKQAILDGFINYEEVQKKMQRASIIIIPSIWEEPFGLVVAEAMSNGVAVVTSKVGGIPEVIKDNGIVLHDINETQIVNALLELLNKPEELVKYQKLSWNNFSHTAFLSASKLDDYRNKIMFKFIK